MFDTKIEVEMKKTPFKTKMKSLKKFYQCQNHILYLNDPQDQN